MLNLLSNDIPVMLLLGHFVYHKALELVSTKGLQWYWTRKSSFSIPRFNILWTEVWSYDLEHKILK